MLSQIVTPAFNAYAVLKRFNHHRGFPAFVILGSLLPLLHFRSVNSSTLLTRLLGKESTGLNSTTGGSLFRLSTCMLCLALMFLDVTWGKWVLLNMKKIAYILLQKKTIQ